MSSVSPMPHLDDDSYDGIVLRTFPFGEADLILRVLAPVGGKRSILAKSARREKSRFKVHLDVFDEGRFDVKIGRGSLEMLSDFRPKRSSQKIRTDIDAFIAASLLVECFDFLVPEHSPEAQEHFENLQLGLRAFEEATSLRDILRSCYMSLSELLRVSGFGIDDDRQPSINNFRLLIDKVEQASEKPLATKPSITELLARWTHLAKAQSTT